MAEKGGKMRLANRMRLNKLKGSQDEQFAFKLLSKADEKLHKTYLKNF